jgi:protein-disulfide isomerase
MKRSLPFAIILGVLLLALGSGALLFRLHQPPPLPPKAAYGRPGAEPPHVRGLASAPVALEEFGDFECKPCSILFPMLQKIEHDYDQRLSVTFREHPLAQHPHALEAARAAEAAGLQGRFWEMHDALYENRSVWVRVQDVRILFNNYASQIGLDLERFKKEMDGDEVTKRITADNDRGASLGVDRTPIIFVNGRQIDLPAEVEEAIRREIDAALGVKKR